MRILDLCCGLGGAGMGYARAGFEVEGVDVVDQPDYPFEFHKGDAFAFLIANYDRFDAVHTSWPCQASAGPTKGTNAKRNKANGKRHLDLNPSGRALLDEIGLPYVMENVVGSVLRKDVVLCGLSFGLKVFRHRYFEFGGWSLTMEPVHKSHAGHRVRGYRHGRHYDGDMYAIYGNGGDKATVDEAREGLGIDWSRNRAQLVEAIPPAYTEFIGRQLMTQLKERAA